MSLAEVFGAPFTWCDRKCERCPLADECPVRRGELQSRWVHEARGENPDDMSVVVNDIAQDMERVMVELRRIAAQDGIDLDAPLPPRPISLDAERLRRAGLDLMTALHRLPRNDENDGLCSIALTAVMKANRVASHLDLGGDGADDAWAADAVPNLLLLDRLLRDVREGLLRLDDDGGAGRSLQTILRVLAPLIAEVTPQARKVLARLIARQLAPSPFCTVAASQQPGSDLNLHDDSSK